MKSRTIISLVISTFCPLASAQESGNEALNAAQGQHQPAGLSSTEWASVSDQLSTLQREVREVGEAHVARNPEQGWTTHFDGEGFMTMPRSKSWAWGLELASFGFAESQENVADKAAISTDGVRLAYDWGGTLEEWYINNADGLEHGYTLEQRPQRWGSNESDPLMLTLKVRGDLEATVTASERAVHFLDKNGALAVTYSGLYVFDATGNEVSARFQGSGREVQILINERDAVYPLTIDPVAQQAYIKASNTEQGDNFGSSVAVSGNTLVIGARTEDSASVGINADEVDNSQLDSGAAYVFTRTGTDWSQQAYLKASNTEAFDQFGSTVAIDGDTIAIGSSSALASSNGEASSATGVNGDETDNSAPGSGAVYVFVRNGTTWTQEAYIKASNTDGDDHFGQAIDLSSNTLIVGAPSEASDADSSGGNQADNSAPLAGAAYIFVRNGTTWSQQSYLKAFNSDADDLFGLSVALDGDTAVVGAAHEASSGTGVNSPITGNSAARAGAAYVFTRAGTSWSPQAFIKASNTEASDNFGVHCSISGNTISIGADGEDSNATGINGDEGDNGASRAGAVYVFVRTGTDWNQEAYVKASNTSPLDGFSANALDGDSLVIGAPGECGFSSGINGDQTTAPSCFSFTGAVYAFNRTGTTWEQLAYIKASSPTAFDGFASQISISGNTALVGSLRENSSSTGINGDQNNSAAPCSGAAYVFDLDAPLPANAIGTATCFGDGGDQAGCVNCPCMNNATAGTTGGCRNSAFTSARLEALGNPSVSLPAGSNDDLRFSLSGAPPLSFCILNSGDGVAPTNMANPCFGVSTGVPSMSFDGLRCAVINTRRHGGRSADGNGNVGDTTSPWGGEGNPPIGIAQAGGGFSAGQTRFFQVIYRDDILLSCMRGLNTTQAIEIAFTP